MKRISRRQLLVSSASTLALRAGVAQAAVRPKVLIDLNQLRPFEAAQAHRLKADGCWLGSWWSPDVDLPMWRDVCGRIGTGVFVSEDGPMHTRDLDDHMSIRVVLRDAAGRCVAPREPGGPLYAEIPGHDPNSRHIFRLYFNNPAQLGAVNPPLLAALQAPRDYSLRASTGAWVHAPDGGGDILQPTGTIPHLWEILRLHKVTPGDPFIRPYDTVALQTWNGVKHGGYFVSADPNRGGLLLSNSPGVGPNETFRVQFASEYIMASYIAPVTHALIYTEFNDAYPSGELPTRDNPNSPPHARDWTLSSPLITEMNNRVGGNRIAVLGRSFGEDRSHPGLPTRREQILNALRNPACKAVVFEMNPGVEVARGSRTYVHPQIFAGIEAVCKARKDCFILLPPRAGMMNYTDAVRLTVSDLKRSPYYSRLHIVLACYNRNETEVGFLGGMNSIEGALQWFKRYA